jgi:hypothetical protein
LVITTTASYKTVDGGGLCVIRLKPHSDLNLPFRELIAHHGGVFRPDDGSIFCRPANKQKTQTKRYIRQKGMRSS